MYPQNIFDESMLCEHVYKHVLHSTDMNYLTYTPSNQYISLGKI